MEHTKAYQEFKKNAASSEENTAISINLAEGAAKMQDRVNIFKLF